MNAAPRILRVTSGSVGLEVLEWRPSTEAHATAVIAVHGAVGDASSWGHEGIAAATGRLGSRPRRFAALSRRGTGGSDTPASGYAFEDFVGDLTRVISALAYAPFILLAHSFGVPIAIGAAGREPRGLVGLVLGDFGPRYPAYSDEWLARVEARQRAGDLAGVRIEGLRALRRDSREIALDDAIRRLRVPVVVLTGTASDVLLTAESRERYERSVRDLEIVTINGAGHMLGVGGNRAPLHGAVGAFLDRLDAGLWSDLTP